MQNKRNLATWLGAVLGIVMALALNATFAHAADNDFVKQEFHKTYPLTANGRFSLQNINGPAHISAWDRNEVKVDAVKRADDEEGLKNVEIRVDARPDSVSVETKYLSQVSAGTTTTIPAWNTPSRCPIMQGWMRFS